MTIKLVGGPKDGSSFTPQDDVRVGDVIRIPVVSPIDGEGLSGDGLFDLEEEATLDFWWSDYEVVAVGHRVEGRYTRWRPRRDWRDYVAGLLGCLLCDRVHGGLRCRREAVVNMLIGEWNGFVGTHLPDKKMEDYTPWLKDVARWKDPNREA